MNVMTLTDPLPPRHPHGCWQTIVGVVNVPGIVEDSVRMNFRHESSGSLPEADSLLALELTFVAKSAKNSDDDAAAVDRGIFYSTVLNIPGGIDPQRVSSSKPHELVRLWSWCSCCFRDPDRLGRLSEDGCSVQGVTELPPDWWVVSFVDGQFKIKIRFFYRVRLAIDELKLRIYALIHLWWKSLLCFRFHVRWCSKYDGD